MELFGHKWQRRELEKRIGRLGQVGGLRRMTLTEGKEAGTAMIQVRTGAGLVFEVVPSKGLDISLAELWGAALSWQSPSGDVHPSYYEPEGDSWLRSASGGLLMTCGLSHAGAPITDDFGKSFGLHGRAHHTPARQVTATEQWDGDEAIWRISGIIEETMIFGAKLRLEREITGRLGSNSIHIRDIVENTGFQPAAHMMLYHFNFGFPLMDERTTVTLPSAESEGRESGMPLEDCGVWQAPDADAAEAVYYHRLRDDAPDQAGMAEAVIFHPAFPAAGVTRPLTVRLRWSAESLPLLVQWRMPGVVEHVLGLEPSNCKVEGGRHLPAAQGGPRMLAPGEAVRYRLELIIH